MCGIAGVVLRNSTVDRTTLETMLDQLRHRGPDGSGIFVHEGFGLGHTRLSINDLEGGQQPLLCPEKNLAAVVNGEIYNFVELRAEMEAAGVSFATRSDSACALHAYALNPENFVQRLNGMFALAILDGRRKVLTLARDRLGVKPLYYALLHDKFIFASEIKAILPLLSGQPELEAEALSQFLHSHCTTGTETVFRGIRRLAPGEIITIDANLNMTSRRYWSALDVAGRRTRSVAALEEEFEDLFRQVMREHMRSDVPFGLFLSGGNDSAILLAMLSLYQDRPVRTFSIGFDDCAFEDELGDAESVAADFSSDHTSIRMNRADFFGRIPYSIWACDDLMRDNASLPTSFLSEAAHRELKVVFCGEGGDEVFGGYPRYWGSKLGWLVESLRAPGSGGFRTRSDWSAETSALLLGERLTREGASFRKPHVSAWKATPRGWSDLQRRQYTDIVTDLTDSLLVKADRMTMSFGIEARVPFLDHRVVEFGLSLPDSLKIANGEPKIFLRRWAERHLPKELLYRPKKGFSVPVREWLRGDWLDRLEKRLMENTAVGEWFDVSAFPRVFNAQRRDGRATREIFGIMQFAIWHRLFVETPGVRPGANEDPLDWISGK